MVRMHAPSSYPQSRWTGRWCIGPRQAYVAMTMTARRCTGARTTQAAVADLVGSLAVIVAALVITATGWTYADPLFGAALGVFILPRAVRLGLKALRVLVQAAPPEMDLAALRAELVKLDGVIDVHDVHVWIQAREVFPAPHRVHQVIGDLGSGERGLERLRAQHVSGDALDVFPSARLKAVAVARSRAHLVPLLRESRNKLATDVAAGAHDKDPHGSWSVLDEVSCVC